MDWEDDGQGDDDEGTEADQKARRTAPAPMWEDEPAEATKTREKPEPVRHLPRRHKDPKHAAKAKQKGGSKGKRR